MLDEAQRYLDGIIPDAFDLRGLLWEVLGDVLDSIRLAETNPNANRKVCPDGTYADFWKNPPSVHDILADYLGDNYGDE